MSFVVLSCRAASHDNQIEPPQAGATPQIILMRTMFGNMSPEWISLLTRISSRAGFSVGALCRQSKSRERLWAWWPLWRRREAFSLWGRKRSLCLGPCLKLCVSLLASWSCSEAPMVPCRPCALCCETAPSRIPPPASVRACPSCWWSRWLLPPPSRCCPLPPHPSCGVQRCSPQRPASPRLCRSALGCLAAWKSG